MYRKNLLRTIEKQREENKIKDIAIVRLEQLYPFPKEQVDKDG